MKNRIYGYCRVSTMKQNIERQISNIKTQYPDAIIIDEAFTGTTMDRPKWNRLMKQLHEGDTVVFDEVSRMSRNADEGFAIYRELFAKGINLVFIKEPHINTAVYRDSMQDKVQMTGTDVDLILAGINQYMMRLAQRQIEIAFQTAQAEVDFLHKRTSEGVRRAQAEGKQVGRAAGTTIETKKAQKAKDIIRKHCRTFGGELNDEECRKLCGIARNSYYKYKRELQA